MLDIVFLAALAAFFGAAVLFVRACALVIGSTPPADQPDP